MDKQVTFSVPGHVWESFESVCKEEGLTPESVLISLVQREADDPYREVMRRYGETHPPHIVNEQAGNEAGR
jgi:hypothetical protein